MLSLCRSSLTTQLMWPVPPIQFIMDSSAAQLSGVEELLKVADMGPDFEPTPLGNILKAMPSPTREQKTISSSRRSDVESLSAFPGPGGSTELVMSNSVDSAKQSFAQHSESWNTSCKDALPPRTSEELTDNQLDNDSSSSDMMSSAAESDSDESIVKDRPSQKSKHSEADGRSTSEVRSDIFGLDHARLWEQVLHAKRKSENRSYKPSDELIAEFSAASESTRKDLTYDMLAHSKIRKHKKSERRNSDYLLSCHYHNNEENQN